MTQFHKLTLGNWLELLLGVLPATLLMIPLFMLGVGVIVGLLFAAGQSSLQTMSPIIVSGTMIFGSLMAGLSGLVSLWCVMFLGIDAISKRRRLRIFVILFLLFGIMDASYWLFGMVKTGHPWGKNLQDWVWSYALVGPIWVGLRYLFALIRHRNSK